MDTHAAEIVAAAQLTLVPLPPTIKGAPASCGFAPAYAPPEPSASCWHGRARDQDMGRLGREHDGRPDDLLNFHHDPVACAVALGWDGATVGGDLAGGRRVGREYQTAARSLLHIAAVATGHAPQGMEQVMTRSPFRIDQPQPNDLVGDPLLIAGTGGGFEATIDIRVLDANGNVLLTTSAQSTNLLSAWQKEVGLPDPLPTKRGVVEVAPSTGADEPEARVSVPVFFGTAIAPGFRSYLLHVVQPGETLSGIAAAEPLYIGGGFGPIFEANRDVIADPNLIHPGQVLRIPADF